MSRTVTKTVDADPDLDVPDDALKSTVTVEGESPPEELRDAVEAALRRTVLHLLDGDVIDWSQRDDGTWVLSFRHGFPEGYAPDGTPLPPYRTREQFEGADGSGDGLMGNLPDDWAYEPKNDTQYLFGRWD